MNIWCLKCEVYWDKKCRGHDVVEKNEKNLKKTFFWIILCEKRIGYKKLQVKGTLLVLNFNFGITLKLAFALVNLKKL